MIDIFHNILWSRYKGGVFSALHAQAVSKGLAVRFYQIAETDSDRVGLSGIDRSFHRYPYELLFAGAYSSVSKTKLIAELFLRVLRSDSRLVLLPGYHAAEFWAMLIAAVLTRKRRAVFCDSTINDRPQSFAKGVLKRVFFRLCHGFFAYGQRSREYLEHYGADPRFIYRRCQAAALPSGYSVEAALDRRLKLLDGCGDPRFLYVGRLSKEKGLDTLMRAFVLVSAKSPKAKLVLVGSGSYHERLAELAVDLGIDGSVSFAGGKNQDELASEYASSTCLVLPSTSEPWGLVVNEALSYGCPVVVSQACGCVPELVIDGQTGFSFAPGDTDALASGMISCIRLVEDVETAAKRCLEAIAPYTPERAAAEVLSGSLELLGRRV